MEIEQSEMNKVKQEIEWMNAFTPYMKCFLEAKKGHNEKDRKAQVLAVLAVMKELVEE